MPDARLPRLWFISKIHPWLMEILGLLILILDIVAIVSVLGGGGSVGHKVLWIVLILLLPLIGMILYFLIGRSPRDA